MENDPLVERFSSVNPHSFSYLVRFDMRLYHPIDGTGPDRLLDLWFCRRDKQTGKIYDTDPHRLRLTCFGIDSSIARHFPSMMGPLFLKVESIRDRQWQDLKYEFIDLEEGSLFYCKSFDVHIEEVAVEWI